MSINIVILLHTGADPGFPIGGDTNPVGGMPTYDFAKFSEKMHEIEKILGHRGGGHVPGAPPKSTTDIDIHMTHITKVPL